MSRPTQEDKYLEAFGKNIAAMRLKRGLTQDQLSNKADLAIDTIAAIEQGRRWARLTTLHKLAKSFGVDINELFRGLKS